MKYTQKLVRTTALGWLAVALSATQAHAADEINPSELVNLSLEQLGNIEVTSVSKKSEKASEAAAAIYVITQDDIRRSGMTSIPELLRMVPGLDVAQSGSHQWAISSRGSNDEFANKLLVLIDGRTVYTPLFSGVYWDVQDTPLQDIERIEVIRGPGATLWGANAVNGVINIITKSAKDTQGGFVSQTAGNQINSMTTTRYGAKLGDSGYVRTYAKYDDYNDVKTVTGARAKDKWDKAQGGFRADWKSGDSQSFTFQGDVYHGREDKAFRLPLANTTYSSVINQETEQGGNVLGRWDHKMSSTSDLTIQMYFDDANRSSELYAENIKTFDFDLQHLWTGIEGQEIIWGAGYRLIDSNTQGTTYVMFTPTSRKDSLYSSFVQDKFTIVPDKLFLTIGSKFEHNEFSGFEFEPSARFSWLVNDKQTFWGSVSRAVKTPNIATDDLKLIVAPIANNFLATQEGNRNSESEELIAYELGYRIQPTKSSSLDVSVFYNEYDKLQRGLQGAVYGPVTTPLGTYMVGPAYDVNNGTASSYGLETSAKWNPTSYAELAAGYTLLELKFDQSDPYGRPLADKSPRQQFNLRSAIQMPNNVEWDTSMYFVGSIAPNGSTAIASYTRLDTKVSWKPFDSMEFSLVGQNLLQDKHREFIGFLYQSDSEIPRSFYGNVTWKF